MTDNLGRPAILKQHPTLEAKISRERGLSLNHFVVMQGKWLHKILAGVITSTVLSRLDNSGSLLELGSPR